MSRVRKAWFVAALLLFAASVAYGQAERPAGWTEETHGKRAEPDWDMAFPQEKVVEMKLIIEPDDWEIMREDIETHQQSGRGPGGFGGGMFGGADGTKPIWVPATVIVDGVVWQHVGVRYKGNSTLSQAYRSGTLKLPLKLNFDKFEDDWPEIHNQRFFGFKQLSLGNAIADPSYLRDAVAYDLLADNDLPASATAWYDITLDYGDGDVHLGLYTAVEVTKDTVLGKEFADDSGTLYEAEGSAASLAEGTRDRLLDAFVPKTNEKHADGSELQALYDALHSEQRESDPVAWREGLEAVFDTDTFLKWLAVAAVLQDWDTYGGMSHNFFLYADPVTDRLTWISWDHDRVFASGFGPEPGGPPAADGFWRTGPENGRRQPPDMPADRAVFRQRAAQPGDGPTPADFPVSFPDFREGFPGGAPDGFPGDFPGEFSDFRGGRGGFGFGNASPDRSETGDNWPLISFLLADPVYNGQYRHYMREVLEVFTLESLTAWVNDKAEIIRPYARADIGEEAFETALEAFLNQATEALEAASAFVTEGD